MRVLIADDDAFSRRLLQRTLDKWGYETIAVDDGDKALELLRQEDAPHLAVVDWMMPGMDGLELCRKIRQFDSGRLVYIIILTAKGKVEDLVQAMEAGADDFTTKSFDVRELKVRLRAAERIVNLEETLRRMATRDCLTKLWNRSAILDLLERELSRAQRNGGAVGVIMADVDHFKQVNDVYGHTGGDAVLMEIASRIRSGLRHYDGAGRYGGEEFLIVLAGAESPSEVAERLRMSIASTAFRVGEKEVPLSASFGTAVSPAGGLLDADTLIQAADMALYGAKQDGRNCVKAAKPWGDRPVAPVSPAVCNPCTGTTPGPMKSGKLA